MSKKCPKNSTFSLYNYIKVLEFLKTLKTFLNKGTKHKKNYMEGLYSKNCHVIKIKILKVSYPLNF